MDDQSGEGTQGAGSSRGDWQQCAKCMDKFMGGQGGQGAQDATAMLATLA